jgi:archaemetzincin
MSAIFLWWIGTGPCPDRTLEDVRAHVQRVYGLPAVLWPGVERPNDTFDPRRGQHASGRVLEWLLRHRPGGAVRTLGVTDVDLFIPILTFVYGEAQLNGPVAVVSTARLGGVPGAAGVRLLGARLAKEAVHELGHTFGLLHCDALRCAMKRSVNVAAIDSKATTLCGDCRTLLLERSLEQENDHEQGPHAHLDRR